jgi:hypothetical protein
MFQFRYNLKHLNNGVLNGVNAMPAKDLTSESEGSFATDRKVYSNIVSTDTANPAPSKMPQKKWIGGCRDASVVSYRRRIAATGTSLNPEGGAIAFMSKTEKNTRIEALNRCRNQGNCVPPKVRASKLALNIPTPIWKPPNLVRTKFHSVLTKETPMQSKKINNVSGYS